MWEQEVWIAGPLRMGRLISQWLVNIVSEADDSKTYVEGPPVAQAFLTVAGSSRNLK